MEDLHTLARLLARLRDSQGRMPLSSEEKHMLEEAVQRYPYFRLPYTELALDADPDTPEGRELRLKAAMRSLGQPDFEAAAGGGEWIGFYPPAPVPDTPDTDSAIDTFLETYGRCTPEEEEMLQKLIFNPVPDYGEMLAREEQANLPEAPREGGELSPEDRIAAFILEKHPAAQPHDAPGDEQSNHPGPKPAPVAPPEAHDDSLLSESLAKIYIRQGRYERAYEIISGLNLKFPKKSVYFADQLRFLEKLIINQRAIQHKKSNPEGSEGHASL